MNLTGGIVMYAVLWFLVLFVLLPLGQRSQADAGEVVPGTPEGAPADPRLGRKMAQATVIAAIVWGLCAWMILGGLVSREAIMGLDQYFRG